MFQAWEDNFDGSDVLSKAMVDAKGSEEPLAQGRCNGFGGGFKAVKISGSDFEEHEDLPKAERKEMTLYSLESALVLTLSIPLCRVFKTYSSHVWHRVCLGMRIQPVVKVCLCAASIKLCCPAVLHNYMRCGSDLCGDLSYCLQARCCCSKHVCILLFLYMGSLSTVTS